jgi:hypothetical protein
VLNSTKSFTPKIQQSKALAPHLDINMSRESLKWRFINPVVIVFAALFVLLLVLLLFFSLPLMAMDDEHTAYTVSLEILRYCGIYIYPYQLNFPRIIGGTQSAAVNFLASIQVIWLVSLLASAQPYQKIIQVFGTLSGVSLSVFWALMISFVLFTSGMA